MALKQPFSNIQRYDFKRSFLKSAKVTVTFAKISFADFEVKIREFINSSFGVQLKESSNLIKIISDDRLISFDFGEDTASVFIDAQIYASYEQSMKPCVDILEAFLKNILHIDLLESVTVEKKSYWEVSTENAIEFWSDALIQTFKDGHIREIATTKLPVSEYPLALVRGADISFPGGKADLKFTVSLKNRNSFNFAMDIKASEDGITMGDFEQDTKVLNDIVYSIYINSLTEEIIKELQKER